MCLFIYVFSCAHTKAGAPVTDEGYCNKYAAVRQGAPHSRLLKSQCYTLALSKKMNTVAGVFDFMRHRRRPQPAASKLRIPLAASSQPGCRRRRRCLKSNAPIVIDFIQTWFCQTKTSVSFFFNLLSSSIPSSIAKDLCVKCFPSREENQ